MNCGRALFDGQTIDPALDGDRLENQLDRVRDLMKDGAWRTLAEIDRILYGHLAGQEGLRIASISARLRDLRKEKFGSNQILRRRVGDPSSGLFEYRMVVGDQMEFGV